MKSKAILAAIALTFLCIVPSAGQDQGPLHGRSLTYTPPREGDVAENLEKWQDRKFGILIHWGLYSELGVVESWSICSEEEDWIGRDSTVAYEDYKRRYWATIDKFNPVNFDASAWAATARVAGMKYVVFTTKHHDGFCLFDTRQTDFSIMHGPFGRDPRANAAKEVFDAFRNEGLMTGAYFSKPDWHSQYYWWDRYATPNRNNNYDIRKNPWRWEKFKEFTFRQIEELVCGDYGKLDILWLDGGWVRPARETDAARMGRAYKGEQDIDMPSIAAMVRGYQPGIIIVDRSVPGEFENYQTPERGIPDTRLTHPWESCITLGNDWGYVPDDPYKSARQVVHMLVEIVAKGGNLVLGIGPKPDGTFPEEVIRRLEEIGKWTARNGEAIYGTRSLPHYNDGRTWFTHSRITGKIYATILLGENEKIPSRLVWDGCYAAEGTSVVLLETGKAVKWKRTAAGMEVTLPKGLPSDLPAVSLGFIPSPEGPKTE